MIAQTSHNTWSEQTIETLPGNMNNKIKLVEETPFARGSFIKPEGNRCFVIFFRKDMQRLTTHELLVGQGNG